ncbi:MAG: SemiSWEET family transporter [bacterium]|nr:SemiSWEET family transporter [bacterium]
MSIFWETWGVVAGIITASGYIPQIIKGYKTKKLDDLSYLLNSMMGVGMAMWIAYGISIHGFAVIATNILGVTLNFILVGMKYHYARKG